MTKFYTKNRARAYAKRSKHGQIYWWRDLRKEQRCYGAFRGDCAWFVLRFQKFNAPLVWWDFIAFASPTQNPAVMFRRYEASGEAIWARSAEEAQLIHALRK